MKIGEKTTIKILPKLDVLLAQACRLRELGRLQEAKMAFVAILQTDPNHVSTLFYYAGLQNQLHRAGDAAAIYERIITLQPRNIDAHLKLSDLQFTHHKIAEARRHIEAALEIDPNCTEAHRGMGIILSELREFDAALEHTKKAFGGRSWSKLPYRGLGKPLNVLVLYATTVGNSPLAHVINDTIFQHISLIPEFHNPVVSLPPHQVVWNAIGDADLCPSQLRLAADLLKKNRTLVINPPDVISRTGRTENARRLSGIEGLVIPKIVELPREALLDPQAPERLQQSGFQFPCLLRAQGFQGGKHFVKLDSAQQLKAALATMPGDDFMVLQYLDARNADGATRKYRVIFIDGQLYPLHVAISTNWKIHYFSADMGDNPQHRAEDEAFLLDMPKVLGPKIMATLENVQARLGLDFGGIDFSVGADGKVLFFEANATMNIPTPDQEEKWNYRRAPVQKLFDAVTSMLRARIGAST